MNALLLYHCRTGASSLRWPSLCELCGLPIPDRYEGASFAPLIDDPERAWKPAASSPYPRQNHQVMGHSMRSSHYRYTEWQDRESGEVLALELYDHRQEPQENVNRAGDPAFAEQVQALAAQLRFGWRGALPQT